jgi:FkbM family methyltransferase
MLDNRIAPWGDTIWFEPSDVSIEPSFLESGIAWPHELEALAAMVHPGDLVLDIGANLGYLTCYLAHLAGPAGEVRAIEPNAFMTALLDRNVSHNQRGTVVIDRLALGEGDGTAQLWLSGTNLQRHSIHAANVPNPVGTETVPQLTADSYWRSHLGQRQVGLLKLDVEGAERLVLASGPQLLSACRDVWMEFWPAGIGRDGTDPYECLEILVDSGFTLTRWDLVTGEYHLVPNILDVKDIIEDPVRCDELRKEGLSPLLYLHGTRVAR